MVKLYRFFTRRLDMTHDEAVEVWLGEHAPLVADALGEHLIRYATNVARPVSWAGEPEEAPAYDGYDQLWLDVPWPHLGGAGPTVEMCKAIRGIFDGAPEVTDSERRFAGLTCPMATEEVIQKETGRPHTFKLVELLTRRRDMTWPESRDIWVGHHAPFVKEVWGDPIVHYTTNLGLSNPFTQRLPDEAPTFDGVAELFWDMDLDDFRKGLVDTADSIVPDEAAFLGTFRGLLVDEVIQYERT